LAVRHQPGVLALVEPLAGFLFTDAGRLRHGAGSGEPLQAQGVENQELGRGSVTHAARTYQGSHLPNPRTGGLYPWIPWVGAASSGKWTVRRRRSACARTP